MQTFDNRSSSHLPKQRKKTLSMHSATQSLKPRIPKLIKSTISSRGSSLQSTQGRNTTRSKSKTKTTKYMTFSNFVNVSHFRSWIILSVRNFNYSISKCTLNRLLLSTRYTTRLIFHNLAAYLTCKSMRCSTSSHLPSCSQIINSKWLDSWSTLTLVTQDLSLISNSYMRYRTIYRKTG